MSTAARAARRHGRGRRSDVILGYCRPETVDGSFFDAVSLMLLHDAEHDGHIGATIGVESGPRIARSRCDVVRKFLEFNVDWLCWLDTDMVPPADMVDQLLAVADVEIRPIVGGLCFAGGRTKVVPTIYTIHNEHGPIESETQLAYPPDQVIEVGGTGSACLLIHRSVFEKIAATLGPDHPLPWYQDCIIDGKDWGEDLVFCLRARGVGARVWIHTGVKVGHRKKWTIDEAAFLRYAAALDAAAGGPQLFTEDNMPDVAILPDDFLVNTPDIAEYAP